MTNEPLDNSIIQNIQATQVIMNHRLDKLEASDLSLGSEVKDLTRKMNRVGKAMSRLEKSFSWKNISQTALLLLNITVAIVSLVLSARAH